MKPFPFAAAALLLCTSVPSSAQTARELDAHEHGAASLDVALDGERLYLDLETPADNVLGFEHAPSTDAQQEAVKTARSHLESADPYALTAAAACTLESAEVSIELAREGAGEGHDEDHGEAHGEDEHAAADHGDDHADEEGHGEHEEHADEEHADGEHAGEEHAGEEHAAGEHDSEGATHSDIRTSHVFLCESPDRLAEVTVALFDRYEGFEEIDAQLVGPGGQTAVELSPGRAVVSFEAVR